MVPAAPQPQAWARPRRTLLPPVSARATQSHESRVVIGTRGGGLPDAMSPQRQLRWAQ
jgi:hypothetical protein